MLKLRDVLFIGPSCVVDTAVQRPLTGDFLVTMHSHRLPMGQAARQLWAHSCTVNPALY